jgi:hypothetical protein
VVEKCQAAQPGTANVSTDLLLIVSRLGLCSCSSFPEYEKYRKWSLSLS